MQYKQQQLAKSEEFTFSSCIKSFSLSVFVSNSSSAFYETIVTVFDRQKVFLKRQEQGVLGKKKGLKIQQLFQRIKDFVSPGLLQIVNGTWFIQGKKSLVVSFTRKSDPGESEVKGKTGDSPPFLHCLCKLFEFLDHAWVDGKADKYVQILKIPTKSGCKEPDPDHFSHIFISIISTPIPNCDIFTTWILFAYTWLHAYTWFFRFEFTFSIYFQPRWKFLFKPKDVFQSILLLLLFKVTRFSL